ncbi:iron complex outermembrane receptor protein [Tenacibaculum adriaticum]|uniref:Iron complex outermembrane receptor protein n=1 Tax=Tenacibaculum adriaticum TaxID=413713 RepID=A0A5S5DT13_9FLAO|nr:TonB-dependent receptor [Tenacibaculum adriaticum]TYP98146.1 iron complex outermembrane receptor protein [Tenacibaculum adriaticum]
MIKNLILFIVILFSSGITFGQRGDLKGSVVTKNNEPITSANISILKTGKGTTTNTSGEYLIKNIKAGTYNLKVSFIGYLTKEISFIIKADETTSLPQITLQEDEEQLNEVLVNGHKNPYVIKKASSSLRLKTPIKQLPQNVQIVSSELLENQMVTNILEGAFRNVSGVSNIEHWGAFARINMRGFRLPAFRNGVNIQDSWGPLSEDMFMVDRIEFVKGPSGFMMAAGEPGGFYNVVTKKPTEQKTANISLMAGSYDTYRAAVDLGGSLTDDKRFLSRLNVMYQHTGSHRDFEDSERYGIAPSLSYKISDKTTFLTEFSYQNLDMIQGAAYVFAPVSRGYASLDRNFTMIDKNFPSTKIKEVSILNKLSHQFNENWSIEAQYVAMNFQQEGATPWTYSIDENGNADRWINIGDAISTGEYFQIYTNGKFNTGGVEHNILAGFDFTEKEYIADFSQAASIDVITPFNTFDPVYGNAVYPTFDRSLPLEQRKSYGYGNNIRSFYAQDELKFLDNKIRLTLAGRHTQLTPQGSETVNKFTPRVGLSADITNQITVYGLYDQSFLAESAALFSGETPKPVEGTIYEGGFKTSFFDGKLQAALSAYLITKNNLATTDYDNPQTDEDGNITSYPFSVQLGEVQSKGFEFDLQGQITDELGIVLNYANTNVEITEDTNPDLIGNKIAGHAKHMTNGWVNYNFNKNTALKGFGLSLGYQYQIDRSSWAWGTDNETDLPDYFRLDGGINWKNDTWRIGLNINNILDEYLYSGANYGSYLYWQSEPGINGRLSVSYKF